VCNCFIEEKQTKDAKKLVQAKIVFFKNKIEKENSDIKHETELLKVDTQEVAVHELTAKYPTFEKYYTSRMKEKKKNSVTEVSNYNLEHLKGVCMCMYACVYGVC
jgi:hypothetical protein